MTVLLGDLTGPSESPCAPPTGTEVCKTDPPSHLAARVLGHGGVTKVTQGQPRLLPYFSVTKPGESLQILQGWN